MGHRCWASHSSVLWQGWAAGLTAETWRASGIPRAAGTLTGATAFSDGGAVLGARLSERVSLGSSMLMELGIAGQLTCIVPALQTMHTLAR